MNITRGFEVLTCRTEIQHEDFIEAVTRNTEDKLLEGIRPFVLTQRFRRHSEDIGYVESRIHMPYVKDEAVKNLEKMKKMYFNEYKLYFDRINRYNDLPWYKRIFKRV